MIVYFYEHVNGFINTLKKEEEADKENKKVTEEEIPYLANIEQILHKVLEVIKDFLPENWFEKLVMVHSDDILYYPNCIAKWREEFKHELIHFEAKFGEKFQIEYKAEQDDINLSYDFNQILKYLQEYKPTSDEETKKRELTLKTILVKRLYITRAKKEEIDRKLSGVKHINIENEDIFIHENEILGTGGFGTVYRGTVLKTSEIVAVKEIRSDRISVNSILSFCIEVLTMDKARFPFVIELVGAHLYYPNRIYTRYCSGRSLFERLHRSKQIDHPPLTPSQLTKIAYQVAVGMSYLHETKIVHRDLKTLNILLDSYDNAYVADFGLSGKTEGNDMVADVGTPNYTAPEILTRNHYGSKVDVYSYAIVLWEMLMKNVPFADLTKDQIYDHIVTHNWRLLLPPESPKGLKKLITQCWSKNPKERPTFKEIVSMFDSGQIFFPNSEPLNFKEIKNEHHCPPLNYDYLFKVLHDPQHKYFSSIVTFIYKNMDSVLKKKLRDSKIIDELVSSKTNFPSILLLASKILIKDYEEYSTFLRKGGENMFKTTLEMHTKEGNISALIFATSIPQDLLCQRMLIFLTQIIHLIGERDPTPNEYILKFISSFKDNIIQSRTYMPIISESLPYVTKDDINDEKTFTAISNIVILCSEYLCSQNFKNKFTKEQLRIFADFIIPKYKVKKKFIECIIKLLKNDSEILPKLIRNILESLTKNKNLSVIFRNLILDIEKNTPHVLDQLILDSTFLSILSNCIKSSENTSIHLFLLFCLSKRNEAPRQISEHEILKTLLEMKEYNTPRLQILSALTISEEFCRNEEAIERIVLLLASSLSGDQTMVNAAIRLILSMSMHELGCHILDENDILEIFVQLLISSSIIDTNSSYTILMNVIQYNIEIPQISLVASCLLHSLLYEFSLKQTILDTLVAIVKADPTCVQVEDLKMYILRITRQDTPVIVLQSFRLLAAVDKEKLIKPDVFNEILQSISQVLREPNFHYPKIIKAALMILETMSEKVALDDFFRSIRLIDYVENVLTFLPENDKRAEYMRSFVEKWKDKEEMKTQTF
ncbi:TKL family protein kinase [Histomonas meleagridis]|uniref:TKL family protein kinase n=1 Tax=Histomonas meleagridis TaxID=135588 RepID=UPI00355A8133|nr:TKL family protein kinase [Histomonas meleagridis]KAH0804277.1 TKL family protein kinase [Histomonas meleagridis]